MKQTIFTATALLALGTALEATTFTFDTDPFAGSTALTTPGRQVVGGEPSITFNVATDTFAFNPSVFGISAIQFANGAANTLATSGLNVIVLRNLDDDNNTATAFGAGSAANLIAARITSPGPGFFIYFNSALDLPRLVFSTNLDDNTADLKILARMTNLAGQVGRDSMELFSAADFETVPEPSSLTLMAAGGALAAILARRRQRRAH